MNDDSAAQTHSARPPHHEDATPDAESAGSAPTARGASQPARSLPTKVAVVLASATAASAFLVGGFAGYALADSGSSASTTQGGPPNQNGGGSQGTPPGQGNQTGQGSQSGTGATQGGGGSGTTSSS